MNNIKGMSEKTRTLFEQFVSEVQKESFAEGYEAGKSSLKTVEDKTPNQQRAELIAKAKKFVESKKNVFGRVAVVDPGSWSPWSCVPHFYKKGNRVTCVLRGYETNKNYATGRTNCMPSDVFNLYIGQAISLGRALQIDIPVEFLKAVQPSETVVGMKIRNEKDFLEAAGGPILKGETYIVAANQLQKYECHTGSAIARSATIIDDTNAQYEVST